MGDTIEAITKATGIKALVDAFSEATGIDCGCEARKEKLNKLFPSKNPKCLEKDEYDYLTIFLDNFKNEISAADQNRVATVHSRVFNHTFHLPCSCNPRLWKQWVSELKSVHDEYNG